MGRALYTKKRAKLSCKFEEVKMLAPKPTIGRNEKP